MKTLLKKYYGYDEFRPLQEEIINNVLAKKDSFVLMPTGGGKSLCYQLPALKFEGLTLVVSPLIALMKDQVDGLKANGVTAEFINSSLAASQIEEIQQRIANNEIKILYIAPERFAVENFQNFLKNLPVELIAIDEAHCISEWGHDFRPEYRNLSQLKKLFPSVPLIALTATATAKVRADIIKQLDLMRAKVFISSFNRENLRLSVEEKKKALPKLVRLLEKYRNESVIIYCHSRKETEELAENLRLNKFKARAYHAGLEPRLRKSAQELFIKDEIDIIVATIAFGMGIDKPDVRLVVHYTFPKTLEGYYQEIGRAGRDGLPSECVMYYTYADARKHEFFINQIEDKKLHNLAQEKLDEVLYYSDLATCRKKYLLKYFGEEMLGENCGACDVCLGTGKGEKFDASVIARKILSAIVRTGSRFGRNYIVEVLLGRKTQKIMINKHSELSVYGLGKDFSETELSHFIKQLVDLGFVSKSEGEYPVLGITKKGAEFMQSQEGLELKKPVKEEAVVKKSKQGELDYNPDLFEQLRQKRKEIADTQGVAPFIIFGDRSLMEMAFYFPKSKGEFSQVSGVGQRKLNQYGNIFLDEINSFVKDNNIIPTVSLEANPLGQEIKTVEVKTKFNVKTRELIQKKISIERIAKNQGFTVGTIINHLEKLIDADEKLDLEYLKLPKDRYEIIVQAFEECGDEKLRPVYDFLGEKYSYDEIKLVRVLMRS